MTTLQSESWSVIQPVRDGNTLFGFIAIHRGNKTHPAFGATRIVDYPTESAALHDVLNLSSLMSQKAALADIAYGGGKGVLFDGPHMKTKVGREHALRVYAKHVNQLGGKFITGSDAGVTQADVDYMGQHSSHIVGLKEDPTMHTAQGLLHALEVVAEEINGTNDLSQLRIAIQGVGKVGHALLDVLSPKVAHIIIADINAGKVQETLKQYPNITAVSPEEILFQEVDILIPCALGGVFTKDNIAHVSARAIVGSANNQLSEDIVGDILHEHNILYAPDYVVNAGGLISVVHEFEKHNDAELLKKRVHGIKDELRYVIQKSKEEGISTHRVASRTAEGKINALFAAEVVQVGAHHENI